MQSTRRQRSGISPTVIILGFVSLLTDISSESIYPLIPLFLVNVLHAQAVDVGIIEGIAESTASVMRIFSGWLSDRLGNRKWVTTAGYALSSVSKPLLAFTTGWHQVFAIRFADRLGKGIRSAPRDALIADVTPADKRGVSFGLHRAMDTVGAVTGPLIAYWLIRTTHIEYRRLFLLTAIPAILGVVLLIVFVKEHRHEGPRQAPPSLSLRQYAKSFRHFLIIAAVFSLGNFSDAFLILRARSVGVAAENVLLIYVLFNTVEAALATYAGVVSDRLGRRNVILAGYVIFAAVYAGFGLAKTQEEIWLLFAFYGLYYALTSGVQNAFATDLIGAGARGTGLGAYSMLTGLALLPASLIAGYLWDKVSPSTPFYYGSGMAVIAAILLVVFFRGSTTYTDT